MAAPAFRSVSSGSGSGTTVATSLPAGWQPDDYAILIVHEGLGGLTMTTPPGWTLIDDEVAESTDGSGASRYGRLLQSGDSAPSVTLGSSEAFSWSIVAYSGVNAATPVEGTFFANPAAGTSQTITGVVVGGPERRVVLHNACDPIGVGSYATTHPDGTTERLDSDFGAGAVYQAIADIEQDASASPYSYTFTHPQSQASMIFALVLAPAAVVEGAAVLTGTGALTATGTRTALGAATLTGTSAQTVAGTRTALGSAALTGAGALTASGGEGALEGLDITLPTRAEVDEHATTLAIDEAPGTLAVDGRADALALDPLEAQTEVDPVTAEAQIVEHVTDVELDPADTQMEMS